MTGSIPLFFNGRVLHAPMSGVPRYATEIHRRFSPEWKVISPRSPRRAGGIAGHLWEQARLPAVTRAGVLFSPGNVGPLLHNNHVVTIHDTSTFDCADAFRGIFGAWYRWMLPRLARRARSVLTVSRFSKESIVRWFEIDPAKVHVIHNGISPPHREHSSEMPDGIGPHERYLLFVGSDDPRKNVPRLVEAFDRLGAPNLKLVIVGGVNPSLFANVHSVGCASSVLRLGRVSDEMLETLYRGALGFIFPSLYEGFGLPPLEAMARGCLVACSNTTSLPEVCGPSLEKGGSVIYFNPLDVEAIRAALAELISLPKEVRLELQAKSLQHAQGFSWDRCASETLSVLEVVRSQFITTKMGDVVVPNRGLR